MINLNKVIYSNEEFIMNISLKIQKGEKISIFGSNGAGKSTLMHLIAGFLTINSGKILINNKNYTKLSSSYRPISIIFQENNLFSHLNVIQNIAIGLNKKFKFDHNDNKKINNILNMFNLKNYINKLPNQLSVGQRQLVAIIRCFLRNKPILLMDEPFSSLDFISKFKLINLINEFCNINNTTLVMVSHDFEDAQKITKRSVIIKKGKIYWDGLTEKMIQKNKKIFNKKIILY